MSRFLLLRQYSATSPEGNQLLPVMIESTGRPSERELNLVKSQEKRGVLLQSLR